MSDIVDRNRLFVPGLGGLYEALTPYSDAVARIGLAFILLPHGFAKLFLDDAVPTSRNFVILGWAFPLAWAYFIGAVEFFGSILLALGLFTRAVALVFVIETSFICFVVLWPNWGWTHRGMEYPLLMGIIALSVFLRGGGRFSLDRLMRKEF